MQIPFISTKLQIPTINRDIVSRPKLTGRLDNGLESKLILVCAPGGYGKTTLTGSWLAAQKMSKAWLSLSEEDNDPNRFALYMVMALQKGLGESGADVGKFIEEAQQPSPEAILTHLINDVAAAGRDCLLALDDFQVITDPEILNSMAFLLDHLPSNLRIVIIGRSKPDLPLARLRARRQLTEIKADDLRFNMDEIRAFISKTMALDLNDDEIAKLSERTEGWIAGLQLAVLAASGCSSPSQLIGNLSGTDRYIYDYLVDEILAQQPEKIQRFLLHTCILDQFCAELCNHMLGIKEGRSIISSLKSTNMFIFSLDATDTWYRYHHLFAEMLLTRLEREYPEKIRDLYNRAYNWFKKEGRIAEALECSVKSRQYDKVEVIAEEWIDSDKSILSVEDIERISRWLKRVPDFFLKSSPKVRLLKAIVMLMSGKIGQSEKIFKKILATSSRKNYPEKIVILSAIGMAVIAYHRYFDADATIRHCQWGLQSTNSKSIETLFAHHYDIRGRLLLGDTTNTERQLNELTALVNRLKLSFSLLPTAWSRLYTIKGRLQMALSQNQKHCEQDLKDKKPAFYCSQIIGQAGIFYEYNQLATTKTLLRSIQDTMVKNEFLDQVLMYHHLLMLLHCASNAFGKAQIVLERATKIVTDLNAPPIVMRRIKVLEAHLALNIGDVGRAVQCARIIGRSLIDAVAYDEEPELTALARIHMAQNTFAPAMELLKRMLARANRQKQVHSIIKLETLAAKVFFLQGDENQAMDRLKWALKAAEPGGYVRTFVDEGAPIQSMLHRLLEQEKAHTHPDAFYQYIQTLLNNFGPLAPPAPRASQTPQESDDHSNRLTGREQQVLEQITQGISYEEVSKNLGISINTVRFHIKNIYSKLNVTNRHMAVNKANLKPLRKSHPTTK